MTEKEFSFYEDQKSTRKQKCLSVVEPLTDAKIKFKKRYGFVSQLSDSPTVHTGSEAHSSLSSSHESESITSTLSECSSSEEDSYSKITPLAEGQANQNRKSWPKLAQICERYLISDRAGAAIANSALENVGFITTDNQTFIDPSKLRREQQKFRIQISKSFFNKLMQFILMAKKIPH